MKRQDLLLYAVTDRSWLKADEKLSTQVENAILGGATMVQLREKHLKGNELENLAYEVMKICHKYNVPFIVNDDVLLAARIGADGVHVGQSDMAVKEARRIMGNDKIVGATAKTVKQAIQAKEAGADYIGSGAVFGSNTKKDAKPMDLSLFARICESVTIPVVAIGGITKDNIELLKESGMAGVAVVSGIFAADDVKLAADNLYGKIKTLVKEL